MPVIRICRVFCLFSLFASLAWGCGDTAGTDDDMMDAAPDMVDGDVSADTADTLDTSDISADMVDVSDTNDLADLPATCGDGVVNQPTETCDDGNQVDGDGCTAACAEEVCGNGVLDAGEACDDGNLIDSDGCQSTCVIQGCGDGITDPTEACDDGNNFDGDGCSADCSSDETCGNGIIDKDEVCDDGNIVSGDGCQETCQLPVCGDGFLDPAETCDDSNNLPGDGCDEACGSDESCGNMLVDIDEGCDDGNNVDDDGCTNACTLPGCGDGRIDPGELCDDGNLFDGDGCAATCISNETCGNGIFDLRAGEGCDDGNSQDGDDCNNACRRPTCGDGMADSDEVCDDGNNLDGDGCSSACVSDESCGNGVLDVALGESCDDGGLAPGDGCDAACLRECPVTHTLCGFQCVQTDTNVSHCGACNNACTLTQACVSGVCVAQPTCSLDPTLFPVAIGGIGAGEVVFDGTCDLLVAVTEPDTIVRVDGTTGVVSPVYARGNAGEYMPALAFNHSDQLIYAGTTDGVILSVDSMGMANPIYTHNDQIESIVVAPSSFGSRGGHLIAASRNGILDIDPSLRTATYLVAGTSTYSDLLFDSAGTLYAVNYTMRTVETVAADGSITTVVAQLVAGNPDGIAVDATNGRAFVSDQFRDDLYEVVLATGAATDIGDYDFDGSWFPTGLLWDGNGNLLMALGESNKTLVVIQP